MALIQDPEWRMAAQAAVAIVLYVLTRCAVVWFVRRAGRNAGHDSDRIRGVLAFAERGVALFFLVVLVLVLGVWDNLAIYLGSFLAVVGVALFAQWSLLSNLTAGFLIFTHRDLRLGDRIRILLEADATIEGRIVEFRLMWFVLRRDDGFRIVCPNNLITQRPMVCLTHGQETVGLAMPPPPPPPRD
jgi:small-conductance mechanosensitive channel